VADADAGLADAGVADAGVADAGAIGAHGAALDPPAPGGAVRWTFCQSNSNAWRIFALNAISWSR
jgi:hypothetical protein